MMSCFLIPLPLFFCAPRPALLLLSVFLSTNPTRFCVFCLFFPCICVSLLSLVSKQGSRAFGNSSYYFFFCSFLLSFSVFDCFTVTVYVDSLFSLDSVFSWNSKLDDKSADTFFLADTESQGLPLSHSP